MEENEQQCKDPHLVETFGKLTALEDGAYDVIDVSLDIETLSLKPNAVVLSIGACTVDKDFHGYLLQEPQIFKRRDVDPETVEWHRNDHLTLFTAQTTQCSLRGLSPAVVLESLYAWFAALQLQHCGNEIQIWMNSPSFDGVILQNLANDFATPLPWTFRQERDLRTLKKLALVLEPDLMDAIQPNNNAHDALADAQHQLKIISHCKTILGL